MKRKIVLNVNNDNYEVEIEPSRLLADVIREDIGLTGTKKGCEIGVCGACTVLLDNKPVLSCLTLAVACKDKEITTIEGLMKGDTLHPLQSSFIQKGAIQCGFCTPGMILSAKALLDENQKPTEDEIKTAIEGNLCRCGGYVQIIRAIKAAAEKGDAG